MRSGPVQEEFRCPDRNRRTALTARAPLDGMWLGTLFSGDYPAALALAQRVQCEARDSVAEAADLVYGRMMALTLHFMGEFAEARRFIEFILQHPLRSAPLEHDKVFYTDLEVATYTVSARNAWIEGYPDRASDMARHGVEHAISIDNAVGICYAIARELLSPIRDRFSEGLKTRDCLRADALLQELGALQDTERHESTVPVT